MGGIITLGRARPYASFMFSQCREMLKSVATDGPAARSALAFAVHWLEVGLHIRNKRERCHPDHQFVVIDLIDAMKPRLRDGYFKGIEKALVEGTYPGKIVPAWVLDELGEMKHEIDPDFTVDVLGDGKSE